MMSLLRMFTAVALLAAPAGAAEKFSLYPELMGAPQRMAVAFDIHEAELRFDYASYACTDRQNHDGDPITEAQQLQACKDAIEALYSITSNGYCRDEKTYTWRTCKFTDD